MSRTRLLIPLVAVLAAFALPAAASASFQARIIDSKHVNLTGSDAAESVTVGRDALGRLTHDQTTPGFASALDFDTTTPGTQTVTGGQYVVVDGEGGDDRITLTATTAALRADGGEGDDIIYGAALRDTIQGASGADVVDGVGGADNIFLGSGDDYYLWNTAGGSDRIEAGDGEDTAVLSGTSEADRVDIDGDQTRFAVEFAAGPGVRLYATEHLTLGLFEGDDVLASHPMPAGLRYDVDGGTGDDHLEGGPDADRINGGSGRDELFGASGDDVLFGEGIVGGEGNDRMTLPTTGTAPLGTDGEEGYDVTRMMATPADDTLTVAPQGAFLKVAGALIASEALVLDTGAGNDSATVQPSAGTLSAIALNGGAGDDVLRGSDGIEWLSGSVGQDLVDGGIAPDHLFGGADADVIRARDRAADAIDCQTGDDIVIADLADLDQLADAPSCEHVDRAAATAPTALARVGATDELRLGSGTVKVPVACSAGARGGCQGTVTLVSAGPIAVADTTAPALLGHQSFSLAPGTTADVVVNVDDTDDLVRAAGGWGLPVKAQVLTALAEHTTDVPLSIPR